MYRDRFGEFVALNIIIIFYLNPFERTPRMGPESRSCTFPLGRPVSRKADNIILLIQSLVDRFG